MRPYDAADSRQIWTEAVAAIPTSDVDPQSPPRFTINRATKIASAGSCFAKRIAQELSARGFTYVKTEQHSDFSARYGNIYTTRQLAQLLERATGASSPADDVWTNRKADTSIRSGRAPSRKGSRRSKHASRPPGAPQRGDSRDRDRRGLHIYSWADRDVGLARSTALHIPRRRDMEREYDPQKHVFHNSDVFENVAYLERFLEWRIRSTRNCACCFPSRPCRSRLPTSVRTSLARRPTRSRCCGSPPKKFAGVIRTSTTSHRTRSSRGRATGRRILRKTGETSAMRGRARDAVVL